MPQRKSTACLNHTAFLIFVTMEIKLRNLWCALLLAIMATAAQASRASLRRVETDLVSSSQTSMGTFLDGFNSILDIAEDIYTRVHGYIDGQGRRQEEGRKNPPNKGHLWALLIAGSAGFGNYRHQADVAHVRSMMHCCIVANPIVNTPNATREENCLELSLPFLSAVIPCVA